MHCQEIRRLALSTALAVSLGLLAPATSAQETGGAAGPTGMSETAAGDMMFTPENVDPAQPFGELDVTTAGTTPEESQSFFEGLSPEQQTEVQGRCGVILSPVHQERYAEEAASVLCRNLLEAGLVQESEAEATPAEGAADATTQDAPAGGTTTEGTATESTPAEGAAGQAPRN